MSILFIDHLMLDFISKVTVPHFFTLMKDRHSLEGKGIRRLEAGIADCWSCICFYLNRCFKKHQIIFCEKAIMHHIRRLEKRGALSVTWR